MKNTSEKLTKSKERVKKHGEVYTPKFIVDKMVGYAFQEDKTEDEYIDMTFLEPSFGNGNFILGILEKKLLYCKTNNDIIRAVKSIYGFELLADNVEETKQRILDYLPKIDGIRVILDRNLVCMDALAGMYQLQNGIEWDDLDTNLKYAFKSKKYYY